MAFRPFDGKSTHRTGSFAIKDILDLPDERSPSRESTKTLTTSPEKDSPLQTSSCVARPLFPLALRPGVNVFGANSIQPYPQWPLGPRYLPGWVNDPCAYLCPDFYQGYNPNWRRSRRPLRKKKQRPLFSQHQVRTLEDEFNSKKYLTEEKRADLSQRLKLTETQVKTWFQNRRTKWRKEAKVIKDTAKPMNVGDTSRDAGVGQDGCLSLRAPQEDSSPPTPPPREKVQSPMFFIDLNSSKTGVIQAVRT